MNPLNNLRTKKRMYSLHQRELGFNGSNELQRSFLDDCLARIRDMEFYDVKRPLFSRTTVLKWHPVVESLLFIGSKHGGLAVWNLEQESTHKILQSEIGAGASLSSVTPSPWHSDYFFATNLDGKIYLGNLASNSLDTLHNSSDDGKNKLIFSSAVCKDSELLVAGNNNGSIDLFDTQGFKIKHLGEIHAHTNRVTHLEFSPWNDRVLLSASMDGTVCLWDMRQFLARAQNSAYTGFFKIGAPPPMPLARLQHDSGVTSAQFARSGSRHQFISTDIHRVVRVYQERTLVDTGVPVGIEPVDNKASQVSGDREGLADSDSEWVCTQIINEPQRTFQASTPIEAEWHPSCDLIVVGRWAKFPRYLIDSGVAISSVSASKVKGDVTGKPMIDFIDAETGKLMHQICSYDLPMTATLNTFSSHGIYLASAHGSNVAVHKRPTPDSARIVTSDKRVNNRGHGD